jgi:hypothetical protein
VLRQGLFVVENLDVPGAQRVGERVVRGASCRQIPGSAAAIASPGRRITTRRSGATMLWAP